MSLFNYIRESKGELKHITWPSKKQATAYTIIVILVSLFVAAYLGVFDYLFTEVITKFFI